MIRDRGYIIRYFTMDGMDLNLIRIAKWVEKTVLKDNERKYFRFRMARFYGDICTGDVVGCNLSCIYCWIGKAREDPQLSGEFYSPDKVAEKLIDMSKRSDTKKIRLSGGEPTIGRSHLLALLELLPSDISLILETNGTLIDRDYADELSKFGNIHVRVSLKGATPEEFERLTLRGGEGFYLQMNALRNLINAGVSVHPAIIDLTPVSGLAKLTEKLADIDEKLAVGLEYERFVPSPRVIERMKKHGFVYP